MEHMDMFWLPLYVAELAAWEVVTMAADRWHVCAIPRCLSGDMSGKQTARAICREHNRALRKRQRQDAALREALELLSAAVDVLGQAYMPCRWEGLKDETIEYAEKLLAKVEKSNNGNT